jgi:anti-sigma factor ChrR (cupin superfamily)
MQVMDKTTDGAPVTRLVTLPYPRFSNLEEIPWKPWVMPGVTCKLLSVNRVNGGFTCLLNVPPADVAPVHHHLGALEIFVMSGDMSYEDADIGRAGSYLYEPAGDIHQPRTKDGTVLLCVFHGPIAGLEDDGRVAGIVDQAAMLRWAEEHGVIDHVANR